jgi:hypothetical protein
LPPYLSRSLRRALGRIVFAGFERESRGENLWIRARKVSVRRMQHGG